MSIGNKWVELETVTLSDSIPPEYSRQLETLNCFTNCIHISDKSANIFFPTVIS